MPTLPPAGTHGQGQPFAQPPFLPHFLTANSAAPPLSAQTGCDFHEHMQKYLDLSVSNYLLPKLDTC